MPRISVARLICFLKNNTGFTLIEVLVALALIGMISAVAIPNLRQFSAEEELKNSSSSVLNTLKLAQSSTLARTKCTLTPSEGSKGWKVLLNTSPTNNYSLIAECETSGDITIKTNPYKIDSQTNASIVIAASSNLCGSTPIYIIFRNGITTYLCSGNSESQILVSSPVVITLAATGASPKTITITRGGILSVN